MFLSSKLFGQNLKILSITSLISSFEDISPVHDLFLFKIIFMMHWSSPLSRNRIL